MGTDHGGYPTIEVPSHADLLARGLGVHVDEHVVDLRPERVQGGIGFRERVPPGVHEKVARQRDDTETHPVSGHDAPAVARLAAQEVGWTDDPLLGIQERIDIPMPVGVVAQRDHIHT